MLTDFYVAFATVCFTLLGLWIIVVQTRHAEWRHSAIHRRRAYGVALHFSLPGLMSLLSLVDPASTTLWRISFAVVAAGGVLALVLVRGPAPTGLGAAAYGAAVVLYLLIALVAVVSAWWPTSGCWCGRCGWRRCCLTRRRPHPTLGIPHNPVGDDARIAAVPLSSLLAT